MLSKQLSKRSSAENVGIVLGFVLGGLLSSLLFRITEPQDRLWPFGITAGLALLAYAFFWWQCRREADAAWLLGASFFKWLSVPAIASLGVVVLLSTL